MQKYSCKIKLPQRLNMFSILRKKKLSHEFFFRSLHAMPFSSNLDHMFGEIITISQKKNTNFAYKTVFKFFTILGFFTFDVIFLLPNTRLVINHLKHQG